MTLYSTTASVCVLRRSCADAMEAVKQGSACVGCRVCRQRIRTTLTHPTTGVCSYSPPGARSQSKTHVVIAALKRAENDLSSFQPKARSTFLLTACTRTRSLCHCASAQVFKVDDHLGIACSGLISDGRVLCRYMRNECVNHRFVYDSPMAVSKLVGQVADRSQANTQRSWKRPYGVGLVRLSCCCALPATCCHLMCLAAGSWL